MDKNKKTNDSDSELIKELEEPAQKVELGAEPEPKQATEPGPQSKSESDKKPIPNEALVDEFTTGLIKSLNIVQTGICLTISKSERTEINKRFYNFDEDETRALHGIWYPIVLKWYLKIPMELVAIGITATILTEKFAKAKGDMIKDKK